MSLEFVTKEDDIRCFTGEVMINIEPIYGIMDTLELLLNKTNEIEFIFRL